MHVDINSQITWRCEVVARPRATYTWYKDSKVITSVPGKFEINSNVLKLTNIQLGDSGMYQCGASNVYGTVFGGAQLRVLCKYTYQCEASNVYVSVVWGSVRDPL